MLIHIARVVGFLVAMALAMMPSALAQDPSLVGYWNFEDGSGTNTTDVSGNNLTGVLENEPAWAASPFGQYCLMFDGSNDRVLIGNPDPLKLTGAMTACAWVRHDMGTNIGNTAAHGRIVNKLGNSKAPKQAGWSLNLESWDEPASWAFMIATSATATVGAQAPGARALSNQWVHLAGVYDPSVPAVRIYTNGVLGGENTVNVPTSQYDSLTNVCIGRRSSGTTENPFKGLIDEVRIYSRALSPAEIQSLAVTPPQEPLSVDESYPQDAITSVCAPAPPTLEVRLLTGTSPIAAQWHDASSGAPIAGQTGLTFTAPLANGSFFCVITNPANVVTSRTAVLVVTNDTVQPTIRSAMSPGKPLVVRVLFSEPVIADTAANPANYTLLSSLQESVWVNAAALQADGCTVVLDLGSGLVDGLSYTLGVSDVKDLCSNDILPNSTFEFPYSELVGYWRFEEGTGTLSADQSIYGASVSLLNGTLWGEGAIGQFSADFDGLNDRILVGNPEHLRITGSMTLSAWVFYRGNTNATGQHGRILSKGAASSARGWSLNVEEWDALGAWSFQVASANNASKACSAPGARLMTNQWIHLAGVYDQNPLGLPLMRLYTNGVLAMEFTDAVPFSQHNSANNVYIGSCAIVSPTSVSQGNYWQGMIDEVRIYSRALGEADIAALAVLPPKLRFGPATTSEGQIHLNWTGSGQLEWAPSSDGPWTPVAPAPAGAYSEPVVPDANRFFRLSTIQ